MTLRLRRLLASTLVIGALTLVALAPGLGIERLVLPAQAATAIGFTPTTVVDDQRAATEPDVKVCGMNSTWSYGNCGQNNPYSSAPWGFSTTSSFVWRSEDQGKTFRLVSSNNTTGKPNTCPGGGDSDIAVNPGSDQQHDFVNFVDLQGLTNFSTATSPDGGTTWDCRSVSSEATGVDRQWYGIYKNPAGAPGNGSLVYLDYDDDAATGNCATDTTARGNVFVVQTSTDGGKQFSPPTVVDCNDGIAGNMEVNQTNGHVFAVHTGYSVVQNGGSPDVNQALTEDAIYLDRSTNKGATWSRFKVFGCTPSPIPNPTTDCATGQDFAVLAIDKAGNLYVVWSQAPVKDFSGTVHISGPSHIYYAMSRNEGSSWTAPRRVDFAGTDVNLFPWITAGNAGKIDIVWYGTKKDASLGAGSPDFGYESGNQITNWFPYLVQSLNTTATNPTVSSAVQVSQYPNHNGGICTMGIGCLTGGDRSLGDFFQVATNKLGAAVVSWADTANNGNTSQSGNAAAMIHYAQQNSGPTLFGTTLNGTNTTCTAVTATPCRSDLILGGRYEANGTIGPNVPKMDIRGASLNVDPADSTKLDARIFLSDLSSLPSATEPGIQATDQYVDYMVSWIYHVPGHTQADYDSTGNIYYAYLEVNRATGATTAYDGNTCAIASTKPKYLVYPGQNAITTNVDTTNNTIDLYVPRSDVGSPPSSATLYSVTAHAVGQPGPAGPNSCARDANGNPNAATDAGPGAEVFDVYDKSPAFTSKLSS